MPWGRAWPQPDWSVAEERPAGKGKRAAGAAEPIGLGVQRLRLGERTGLARALIKLLSRIDLLSHAHKLSTDL